eukprot:CAMPEP_0184735476 /NCGR_PEP_ID=MMETSP0314-20130426/61884_1 /TAXON_ID=38298 /ORGANISM="Rhodella maculata, Strain CCMP 736" /LENGTH=366 /DNA_ID=CAMNT_0027202519 /DNA_START=228 /DNA_END=1324 /DNA_ORIENTATION=-
MTAATESVPVAERSARTLKNTVRSIMADLPFNVPRKIIGELLRYAARRANTFGTSCLPKGVTPLELFTGRKADMKKYAARRANPFGTSCLPKGVTPLELFTGRKADMKTETRFAFGDFGQAHFAKVDNTMKERTTGCIALRPVGNVEGSWRFLNLSTEEITTRQKFTPQPMPSEIIERLNKMRGSGPPLGEDDATQSRGGGDVIPAGGLEAARAADEEKKEGGANRQAANTDAKEARHDQPEPDADAETYDDLGYGSLDASAETDDDLGYGTLNAASTKTADDEARAETAEDDGCAETDSDEGYGELGGAATSKEGHSGVGSMGTSGEGGEVVDEESLELTSDAGGEFIPSAKASGRATGACREKG